MHRLINTYRLLFLLWMAIWGISPMTLAQDCETKLQKAEIRYEAGQLRDVPDLIGDCIKGGLNKSQKERAYKLLILSYLYLDQEELAEDYMLRLLKFNPQFEVTSVDPPELIYLYNRFRTDPVFSIAVRAGINNTYVNNIQVHGIDVTPYSYQAYRNKVGLQFGVEMDFHLWKKFEISAGVNYINLKIDQIDSLKTTLYSDAERPAGYNFSTLLSLENQSWIEMPINLKYRFDFDKLKPYVFGGISPKYLIGANINLNRINTDPSDIETPQRPVNGPPIKLIKDDIRQRFSYGIGFGAGVEYDLGGDFLLIEIGYEQGFVNLRNQEAPFDANKELLYRYGYVDNDFKTNVARFSIGYVRPFYKPKKLKRNE